MQIVVSQAQLETDLQESSNYSKVLNTQLTNGKRKRKVLTAQQVARGKRTFHYKEPSVPSLI